MFIATHYKGKPAVFDKVANEYHTGFATMQEAINYAYSLNNA